MHVPIHILFQDGQSILGSRDTQAGWCSLLVPIQVLWFAHPGAILERSEYFGSYGQVWYNQYSILRISMPFDGVTGHPSIFTDNNSEVICLV